MQTHKMNLSSVPYAKIASGSKIIESRLYDEKRQAVEIGDMIIFSEGGNGGESVSTLVIGLLRYTDFKTLFNDHDPQMFGGTSVDSLLTEIQKFYPPEKESKFGVVGIRVKKM